MGHETTPQEQQNDDNRRIKHYKKVDSLDQVARDKRRSSLQKSIGVPAGNTTADIANTGDHIYKAVRNALTKDYWETPVDKNKKKKKSKKSTKSEHPYTK